ncbi:MAG: dihydrodipicolinate reductase [Chloroflexi bacterium]|nr:dihydrodipicolinate reductase [Chloroflexota bacterium]
MLQRPIRVVMYGLGQIGTDIARLILKQPHLQLVGGIERDPLKVGGDLGELLGSSQPLGARVRASAGDVLRQTRPDVVVIATASFLRDVFPQIRDCLAVGARVVSTCEELVYPPASHPEIAQDLEEEAQAAGVAVLGIGSNPGFVMDMLPILLTAPSIDIQRVRVERVVDASTRRVTLQQRIGAGLDPLAFRDWLHQRTTPHVGLVHSLRMIADAFGWQLDRIDEHTEPIIAESWLRTPYVTAAPGQVAGIHQSARGFVERREVLNLDWRTAIGLTNTYDAIRIEGTPPIDMLVRGGVHGDLATAALVVRAIPHLMQLRPGLRTVLDLPVLHYTQAQSPLSRERGQSAGPLRPTNITSS